MNRYIHTNCLTFLVLLIFLMSSCNLLHDDNSDCYYYLKFKYDYNMQNKDLFAEQVEQVAVYVFDGNNKYIATYKESGAALKQNGYKMVLPYSFKDCVIVTWAGKTESYYYIPDMKIGDSIEKLTFIFSPENNLSKEKIDNIWYSGPTATTFTEDNGFAQTISLIRDTNDIFFKLTDKSGEALNPSNYEIKIQSANGAYDYKNNYHSTNPIITHIPHTFTDNNVSLFRMMRFVDKDETRLSIVDKSTGSVVSIGGEQSINLIEYFKKSAPDNMTTQEYLDRRYEWDITLNIDTGKFIAVSITVNGWTVWFDKVDI